MSPARFRPEAEEVARAVWRGRGSGHGAHGRGGVPPSPRFGLGALLIDEPLCVVACEFIFRWFDNRPSRSPNFYLVFCNCRELEVLLASQSFVLFCFFLKKKNTSVEITPYFIQRYTLSQHKP